ncbi:hypothetical protein SteCoe_37437 [Stentor coeruleus]|uniref:CNH domain-containing protein n=1 Tax=Stentor coeruleus TaxID=5963 RepID=A0A1R2AND2_9CILI|nr:hypothetical protein SteCoe_37437 [Stentor coeruleus]
MLLFIKPGFLTYSIIKLQSPFKISISYLPIIDDTHWASLRSEILSRCPLRGISTQDFASRKLFCALIRYEDICCLQFFLINKAGKELLPGPWSVQYLPNCTSEILSVHNSIIAFSRKKIFQFQLLNEKSVVIEAEEVTSIMNYSDKSNRILFACKNKLMWLHIGPDNMK